MSLLERTNQRWKLYVFCALMALGAGLTLFQGFISNRIGKDHITDIVVGGMLLVAGGIIWAYSAICCPNCKLKLFWHALTKEGLGSWFIWLINQDECPQCGSRDGLAPKANKGKSRKRN